MADIEKIKKTINELAGRRKNVKASEIKWVMDQLMNHGHTVTSKDWMHGVVYSIGSESFNVCTHNRGSSQIKAYYVDAFLDAMSAVGLYEG